eukprot:TRINITY_DN4461_c0_g1_i1.p1 TRINITY_DN4461_c0_g1~~TRINITY_DN4461_c0_g1_i1.p1  ORF type:complete len:147 (-),score=29.29 TRINITY_DN4461_c0_g1_i1:24-464(-)
MKFFRGTVQARELNDDKLSVLHRAGQDEAEAFPIPSKKKFRKLIEREGTKMAHLITYIKTLPVDSKVILFSQWEGMLRRVSGTLIENDVQVSFCFGNVMRREKAIREFKGKSSKKKVARHGGNGVSVIMLSLNLSLIHISEPTRPY